MSSSNATSTPNLDSGWPSPQAIADIPKLRTIEAFEATENDIIDIPQYSAVNSSPADKRNMFALTICLSIYKSLIGKFENQWLEVINILWDQMVQSCGTDERAQRRFI